MKYHWQQYFSQWNRYIKYIPGVFRIVAFSVAAGYIYFNPQSYQLVIPSSILLIGLGAYTALRVVYPLRWYTADKLSRTVLGADTAICILLVVSTGGLHSPFLPYCLAPVLTASLLTDRVPTVIIASASIGAVVASHTINPLPVTVLPLEPGVLLLYIFTVVLTATLPYLININLRERMKFQDMLEERQRLSREIHDGAAQMISGIRWQVQTLRKHLSERHLELDEAKQLENLVEEAYRDTRESLEVLRTYTGDGTFIPNLDAYIQHLKKDCEIDYDLEVDTGNLDLGPSVELQLLRICQEALKNVKKHSRAHHVQVKVIPVNGHIKVTISDDGCGFDAVAFYHDGVEAKGHGLAIMKERASTVGGQFRVISMVGRGTEIQVEVPAKSVRG